MKVAQVEQVNSLRSERITMMMMIIIMIIIMIMIRQSGFERHRTGKVLDRTRSGDGQVVLSPFLAGEARR